MKKWLRVIGILSALLVVLHGNAQLLPSNRLDSLPIYTNLEKALQTPGQVYRLDLSRQKLKAFPPEILQLTQLNELTLSKNKLVSLPDEIGALQHLQTLRCSHCELDSFSPGILRLTNLRHLDLSDNYLSVIPDRIEDLDSLRYLILWDNPITLYPNSMGMLEKLEYLDLLHNQMGADTQDRLTNILPRTRIIFSAPCRCEESDPGN